MDGKYISLRSSVGPASAVASMATYPRSPVRGYAISAQARDTVGVWGDTTEREPRANAASTAGGVEDLARTSQVRESKRCKTTGTCEA